MLWLCDVCNLNKKDTDWLEFLTGGNQLGFLAQRA
jgi:hypothetical protein